MKSNRFLRPCLIILAVLYAIDGAYVVVKRALVALIERFTELGAVAFVQGSSAVEFVLFTVCIGLCLLCSAILARGRLRAALLILTAAQAITALTYANTQTFLVAILIVGACCTIVGYALLAHSGQSGDVRVVGWLCAILAGINQLCAALSVYSATMLDSSIPELWFTLFFRAAQISSVLSILANVVQALCFVLLLWSMQRTGSGDTSALPSGANPDEENAAAGTTPKIQENPATESPASSDAVSDTNNETR